MQRYKRRCEVEAMKISVIWETNHCWHRLLFEDGSCKDVPASWSGGRHQPGGYYVIYADGYTGYSTALQFERRYMLTDEDV